MSGLPSLPPGEPVNKALVAATGRDAGLLAGALWVRRDGRRRISINQAAVAESLMHFPSRNSVDEGEEDGFLFFTEVILLINPAGQGSFPLTRCRPDRWRRWRLSLVEAQVSRMSSVHSGNDVSHERPADRARGGADRLQAAAARSCPESWQGGGGSHLTGASFKKKKEEKSDSCLAFVTRQPDGKKVWLCELFICLW